MISQDNTNRKVILQLSDFFYFSLPTWFFCFTGWTFHLSCLIYSVFSPQRHIYILITRMEASVQYHEVSDVVLIYSIWYTCSWLDIYDCSLCSKMSKTCEGYRNVLLGLKVAQELICLLWKLSNFMITIQWKKKLQHVGVNKNPANWLPFPPTYLQRSFAR